MRTFIIVALALVMVLALAVPAFAVNGSAGAGRAYGEHVSMHAKAGHFGQDMSPGMHRGFAGFADHHDH